MYPELGYVSYISEEEDIVHHHFVYCPICEKEDTGTNIYSAIYEYSKNEQLIIQCDDCQSQFEIIDRTGYCYTTIDEIPSSLSETILYICKYMC